METLTTIAPLPILTCANYKLLHISNDGKRTRCGHECERWGSEDRPSLVSEKCPRCGSTADFAAVEALVEARNAQSEARREEANRQSIRRSRAKTAKRDEIDAIVAEALRERGYDVEIETLPAGKRIYVFAATEFEPVAFQVTANEATSVANRVRSRKVPA